MPVQHSFVSAKADGADTTLVRASNWNSPHVVSGYVQEGILNAKGDLLIATANDTPGVLTVGANDTLLMADSAQTAGLKWVGPQTASTLASGDAPAEGTADTYARGDHRHGVPAFFQSIDFSKVGTLTTGVGGFRWYNRTGRTLTVDSVTASVGTAPTGSSIIVDVNKGGSTIYTSQGNRPTIAASTNTVDNTAVPNIATVSDNEYLTIDIDQIGSSGAGADLAVQVWLRG